MAVAAYASVLSLLHVLDQIQHLSRLLPNTKQIQTTLHEKVHFLQEFLEVHSATKIEGIEDMMKEITEVAKEAEDMIDSHVVDLLREEYEDRIYTGLSSLFSQDTTDDDHVVDQRHGRSESTSDIALSSSFCQHIDKLIAKIDSIKEELLTMVKAEGKAVQEQQPGVSFRAGSSTLDSGGKNTVVGFDEHLVRIMDQLTGYRPNLHIIPIVGMGGIGKTTLARLAFENKCVVEHFDVRVWFTISQEYNAHEILLGILRDIQVPGDLKSETLAELGQRLYKKLFGRRFLIVMDDLWSTKGWNDFKLFFPNHGKGSRVMVTTRLSDVANSLGSHNSYLMDFLDEDKSWDLLCEKAFTQGSRPPELEKIGKEIAEGCKGLPLAIVVIGGLLSKSNMTREFWESVNEKVTLHVSSENDEHCFKILSLSYNHLSIHLKSCFLYMGFFPGDYEIKVSTLIELWVSEGFLKPVRGKSLEEVANEYLKDLIERNLILIRKQGLLGEIISCGVHDLIRDLCRRESLKEHCVSVPKSQKIVLRREENDESGCFLVHEGVKLHLPKLLVGSRSCCLGDPYPQLIRLCLVGVKHDGYYEELPLYTKLRYLSLYTNTLHFLSPSTICQLWNLQTLYIVNGRNTAVLPSEIWEMPQLRHIIIPNGFYLPIVTQIERKDFIVLGNLQTLVQVIGFRCTEDVVKRVPNLKELKIRYSPKHDDVDWSNYCLINIANLHKLESLVLHYCKFTHENIAFPYSLKKLELSRCINPWQDMNVIGSLPNLEILELYGVDEDPSSTREWNPVEDGFCQLRFLSIYISTLECWRAESIHFPKLEILKLGYIHELKEIPCGIGEIETLRRIELKDCSNSIKNSAKEMWEEQQNFGNEDLQVIIDGTRYQN
ncbi:hypothetical protein BUALT_Bualt01G0231700 [Buddleja alternifolia]|uniref:Uncharacterized protein n=1 Tax=Buddleja alternifolia TaxID=168488 RepID=A0AAV6YJW8_9LAMI|nr:hypothetical protein BUALT_Bualt01G0231700 [Buddleja alternifolia]